MKRYAGGAINELLPMPLPLLVHQALSENQLIEQDALLDGKGYVVSVVRVSEESWVNIYGRDITEHGKAEAVHPDDRIAVDDAYSGSIQAGRNTYDIEHRVIRRSTGEIRII